MSSEAAGGVTKEACETCDGTGQLPDVSADAEDGALTTCWDCEGLRYKVVSERSQDRQDSRPKDPREIQDDEYEAERLGTVIFLIGAGLIGAKLGVDLFHLATEMTSLPPWYYVAVIAVAGSLAYFFRSMVATLTWIAVFGALLYWGGGFVFRTFF